MSSPAIVAIRHFLMIALDGPSPSERDLVQALDRIAASYHEVGEGKQFDPDLESPEIDRTPFYKHLKQRFPDLGRYGSVEPLLEEFPGTVIVSDAIENLLDLVYDFSEVIWRSQNVGEEDAHWHLRLLHPHWGHSLRELTLYLHNKQYGNLSL